MSQWIITPDKFLSEEEVKRLRKACEETSIIAKSKGNQIAIRNRLIIEVALGTGQLLIFISFFQSFLCSLFFCSFSRRFFHCFLSVFTFSHLYLLICWLPCESFNKHHFLCLCEVITIHSD